MLPKWTLVNARAVQQPRETTDSNPICPPLNRFSVSNVLENVVDPIWAKINKLHNEVMARYEKRDADELAANAATPQNKKEEPARARKSPRAGSRKSDRIAGHV